MIRRLLFRFRALIIILSSLVIFILGMSVTFFPFQEIETLRTGYFQVQLRGKDNPPDYIFVKERPKKWVKLENISSSAYRAIIVSEDAGFYKHNGVDLIELERALRDWIFKKKKLRGASTITQQLVKNIFLNRDKSIFRKMIEYPLALYVDWRLPKKKILEAYLNAIEYGDQIYGINDAAHIYFAKSPSALTIREGAFLAMLLPNPKKYSKSFRQGELTRYAGKIVLRIMRRMVSAGFITQEQYAIQMGERYRFERIEEDDFEIPEEEVSN